MKDYAGGRNLRKKRKTYIDGMLSDDEDEENIERTLDPEDLVKTKSYPAYFVTRMRGEDVTMEHFQRTGFKLPIMVPEKTGLHMRVPDSSFTITDVRNLVGGRRILEVMNSATQSNAEMTLKDWEEFFTDPDRDGTKLNVISLEFSHTKLDSHVVAPRIVRQIDFTDNVWPRHFKELQEDGSNDMAKMLYPKVQKYCLMSIAGCYTDFHVDLGGTSVWYHVLKGKKVFWLIPPTQANLKSFEQWTMSGKQSDHFFGDLVDKCGRVELYPGNTFFIPSGWIHAVYTPEDSLVFGGNYLHPFAIERQLKVAQIEETLKVPHKYRFPFFTEMMWYVLDKYCYSLLGRHHLNMEEVVLTRLLGTDEERKTYVENIGHPYITPEEVRGLKSIVLYLHSLPSNKKGVPTAIRDPVSLIRDIRIIVEVHKNDSQERGVTGRPLLYWPGIKHDSSSWCFTVKNRKKPIRCPAPRVANEGSLQLEPSAVCELCGLDGWWANPSFGQVERNPLECELMECHTCHILAHPTCLPDVGVDGKKNSEHGKLANTWTCPSCVHTPPETSNDVDYGAPVVAPNDGPAEDDTIPSVADSTNSPASPSDSIDTPPSIPRSPIPLPPPPNYNLETPKDEVVKIEGFDGTASSIKEEAMETEEVTSYSEDTIGEQDKLPVVSEAKIFAILERICKSSARVKSAIAAYSSKTPLPEVPIIIMPCLSLLSTPTQGLVKSVCKTWARCLSGNSNTVDLRGSVLSPSTLAHVARLQPDILYIGETCATKQQLTWLLPKLSNTRLLSLSSLDYNLSVSALANPTCPALNCLDLSCVSGLTDPAINLLLRGRDNKKNNLVGLRSLNLSRTEITDVSLRYIAQFLPSLCRLVLSSCPRLTDAGLVQLGDSSLSLANTLVTLDISSCTAVTELAPLVPCVSLRYLYLANTGVSPEIVQRFLTSSSFENLKLKLFRGGIVAPSVS